MSSILETVMLVCFGLSWPLNMVKAYKARTAKGTSLLFLLLIITGYIGGISAKMISGNINYVFAVYIVNLVIVLLNLAVYVRNTSLDRNVEKDMLMNNGLAKESSTVVTSSTKEAMDFAYAMGLKNSNKETDAIETPMDFAYAMGLKLPEKKLASEAPKLSRENVGDASFGMFRQFGMTTTPQSKE